MDTYSVLRQFADSWALLALMILFLGIVVYTFRPGAKRLHDDIAQIPFRNDSPGE